ncbi:MAG: hypothetical protein GY705_02515 [Bacteroidetes bacterium]|nr:hypothetical protein [Bacteroidota bacterium]
MKAKVGKSIMKPKYKNYRIHTSLIEERIKEKETKKRFLRSDVVTDGKRKERLITDTPNQYEIQYLLGPNLSIIVKRLLPIEDIKRLDFSKIEKISQAKYYNQLIDAKAGFEIQNYNYIHQYFRDDLTILYDANKIDLAAKFQLFYDNSAAVSYSRNFNLTRIEFKNGEKESKIGTYNPANIFNILFDMLSEEKKERNYFRWRKGLGFGFNKQKL